MLIMIIMWIMLLLVLKIRLEILSLMLLSNYDNENSYAPNQHDQGTHNSVKIRFVS